MKTIPVYCRNIDAWVDVPKGSTLEDVYNMIRLDMPYGPTNCLVNNRAEGLHYTLNDSRDIEFQDITTDSGLRTYTRSLFFVLYKAVNDHFPGARLRIGMPVSGGYYCTLDIDGGVTEEIVLSLRSYMQQLISANLRFRRVTCHTTDAIELFRRQGLMQKVKLLESIGDIYTHYYTLQTDEDAPVTADFFYGSLLVRTGQLHVFDLIPYGEGILLRIPDQKCPNLLRPMTRQGKMFDVYREERRWVDIMGISTAGELNRALLDGQLGDLVHVSEALQEKKIVQIAEEIFRRFNSPEKVRLVLITGPTSSGKSTICKRLSIQLKACGLHPVSFSTDDYFVNRVETPKLPDGSYDFDNFDTVDHDALQKDVLKLLKGEKVQVPEYNFVTGIREYNGKTLELKDDTILLIEGIHALNPALTDKVPDGVKYKIFINTITSISLDDHNSIATSDNRLLRRIVRDFNKGAFSARETISNWPNVRRSEVQWIYPYQENADVLFNSAYLVEFAVLRNHGEQILSTVPKNCPEYSEAHRLMKFLQYFTPVSDKDVPPTSLLRSFIGGSSL